MQSRGIEPSSFVVSGRRRQEEDRLDCRPLEERDSQVVGYTQPAVVLRWTGIKKMTGQWESNREKERYAGDLGDSRCGTKADYLLQGKVDRERWLGGKTGGDNTSKSGASLKLPSEMAYNRTERKETQDTCVLWWLVKRWEGQTPEVHKVKRPVKCPGPWITRKQQLQDRGV
ncbi:hypothetical protein BY996DRAFT_6525217 [Phakopsora pachyrhizi]|nr:hypothetical protein BY996DRAFT_6525217 [Phakopsora pachyrhizi]